MVLSGRSYDVYLFDGTVYADTAKKADHDGYSAPSEMVPVFEDSKRIREAIALCKDLQLK